MILSNVAISAPFVTATYHYQSGRFFVISTTSRVITSTVCICIAHPEKHQSLRSRGSTVAQYAVLEANAKVSRRGQIAHSHSLAILIYHYVGSGTGRAKFVENRFSRYESAHA